MISEKVRHVSKPAEPFAAHRAYGRITRTREDGPLRITPASKGIPAQAFVMWGDADDTPFFTWERLVDLVPVGKPKRAE